MLSDSVVQVEKIESDPPGLLSYVVHADGEAAVVDLCAGTAESVARLLGERRLHLMLRLYTHAYQNHADGGDLVALLHDLGLDDGAPPPTPFQRLNTLGRGVAPVGPVAGSVVDEELVVQVGSALLELNPRCPLPPQTFVWKDGVGRPGPCTKRLKLAFGTAAIEVLAVSGSARRVAYHVAGHLFTGDKPTGAVERPVQPVLDLLSKWTDVIEAPRVTTFDTAETDPVPVERQGLPPSVPLTGVEPAMKTCSTCGTQFEAHVPMCFIDGTPLDDVPVLSDPSQGATKHDSRGGGSPAERQPVVVSKREPTSAQFSGDRTSLRVRAAVLALLSAVALGVIALMLS